MVGLEDAQSFMGRSGSESSLNVQGTFRRLKKTQKASDRFLSLLSYRNTSCVSRSDEEREADEKT